MGITSESGTAALRTLAGAGISHTIHVYEHDPRVTTFGSEAAIALGVDPARVYKTLVVDTGSGLAVGVVPVSGSLDLKSLARSLGVKKATMAAPLLAERSTGMVLGGISPIGQKRILPTVLDDSMLEHATVLVSGGRRGSDVELAPGDLKRLIGASFAQIRRP